MARSPRAARAGLSWNGTGQFGASRGAGAARPGTSRPPVIEALEGRRLLSATVASPGVARPALVPITIPVSRSASFGVTLHLKAGQPFGGYLGVLEGARVPVGFKVAAGIDWGDGTLPSTGVVLVTQGAATSTSAASTRTPRPATTPLPSRLPPPPFPCRATRRRR